MSIIPVSNQQGNGSNPSSQDLWNPFQNFPENPFPLDLWDPFTDFPFPSPSSLSTFFPHFGASVNTRVDWKETPRAHVLTAVVAGFMNEDVLVELQDDRVLQLSVESGKFMSRFKVPNDGNLEELKASMHNGVLTVIIPKKEPIRPNLRTIQISGSG